MIEPITFVMPTIGRKTIDNAIQSLKNQNSENWRLAIGCDGFAHSEVYPDYRIYQYDIEHKGSAGEIRNFVIEKYVETEWVAFLDDDDEVNSEYVSRWERLKNEVEPDVIIFKMNNYGSIVPTGGGDNWIQSEQIKYGNIGMSFCAKKTCFDENKFDNESLSGSGEDHRMINNLYSKDFKIWVSNYEAYHVRRNPLV